MFKRKKLNRMLFHSAVFRLALLMFLIIVPICILTLVMSSRAIRMAETQVSDDLQEALELNMNQLDNYLENLGRRLYTLSRENEDYAKLMTESGTGSNVSSGERPSGGETAQEQEIERMHAYLRLSGELSDILQEYTWADHVIAYFPDIEFFVSAGNIQTQEVLEVFQKEYWDTEQDSHTRWFVPERNEDLLLGIFEYRNSCYGASFRISRLLELIRLDTSSNIVVFAKNGQGILSEDEELKQTDLFASDQSVTVNGEKYLILTAFSSHSDLVLADLVSRSNLDRTLPGYMRILLFISIIFLICIPLLFAAFSQWLVRPVNILIDAINYVDQGNLDYRIGTRTGTYEFDLLNSNFNEMMDSVKDLKIHVYEKELEKQDIRLQYLSQQIQPHFILNAMNIIYSYEPEEYDLIQKMVLCLSRYFQFIVNASRPYVKVGDELEHITNYLTIQQIRYGNRIRYEVKMEDEAKEAVMPPLMIQNLVENVIKYGLRDDAQVQVLVEAKYLNPMVQIVVRDTGRGIRDDVLELIRKFQESGERQEGLGVGIQNTIERLKLFFGEDAAFEAGRWNHGEGTEIRLTFPARYEET